ncbi:MAG: four helix bundle protein [Bacilli bacterium]
MLQVSRDRNLKIPKNIDIIEQNINNKDDILQIKKTMLKANNQKYKIDNIEKEAEELDQDIKMISKIPFNSNDLIVITVVKKLGAYVITITEKSPKKFRGVFVNRMQNYCLDALEFLIEANYIRMDCTDNKTKRENFQKEAIIKLKLLGYISMLAQTSNCILKKQYKQISMQTSEAINLILAWKKSDDDRWRKRV